jgi:alpha-beta hydrolase superfamily lysophospholipase
MMRLVPVLLLLFLCACAPTFAGRENSVMIPAMNTEFITARDGAKLPMRHWDGEGAPRAVIVALHGMSDYSNAFAMPGAVWAKQGITTLAYDQRGFGRSDTVGTWAGADMMRADLSDAVAAARARYPGVPVFALGESMGGAVLLTALASADPPKVDGAILVAPAVWSRGDMPLTYRAALFLASRLLPGMILSNNAAGKVVRIVPSDNVPMLIALGKDPLFQKRTRTDTLYGLVNLMDEARTAPDGLSNAPPILLLHGLNDQVIPPAPTKAVIARLGPRATVREYPKGYHMLLRDLDGEQVDKDVAAWILAGNKSPSQPLSPGTLPETIMTNTQKPDLRDGKPGADGNTNAKLAGHQNQTMPTSPKDEHAVNPGVGSTAGVGEGQATKSN